MRILIQRVKEAMVVVDGHPVSHIGKGLLLLIGIGKNDTAEDIEYLANKVIKMRIFEDDQKKMNLNIIQSGGSILSVTQFTLYADTKKGNRPGFEQSAAPDIAKDHWHKFNGLLRKEGIEVQEGVFGVHMEVDLVNDGPVTIWLDSINYQ